MLRPILLFIAAAALSGCSVLDGARTPLDAYELRAPDPAITARSTQRIHLVVELPAAGGAINTDRILIRPTRNQIQYLPKSRWSEPVPVMVQTALVETFLRSNAFTYVGRRPVGPNGDYALVSNVLDFGADVISETGGAIVKVTIVGRLIREEDASVVSTRSFSRSVVVADTSTEAILAGFESVTTTIFSDIANWVFKARGVRVNS